MIDTSIRFNDHNSYKVTSLLMGYPFGVEQMDYITHSFQAYCPTALASATRARTKFFDADGATISDVSHSFAVTQVFGKVDITVAVPATAKQAQLVLLQGGTDWWIAEPKSEQGEISTPYNVNYQGQLTYITPNGVYTGMLTANQIVVAGTTTNPDEMLGQRLVTINQNQINLSATVAGIQGRTGSVESRLTTIEAGQITLTTSINGVIQKTTKITSSGVYTGEIVATQITSGTINANRIAVKSITGAKLADGTVTATQIANATITNGKIANLAVTNSKIASLAVTYGKIANLAVDNAKIANLAVTNAKIADLAVTGAKIANATITNGKIANLAVDNAKISSLHGSKITANSITADKINVTNLYVDTVRGLSDTGKYAKFFAEGADQSSLTFYSAAVGGTPQPRGRIKLSGATWFGIEGILKSGTAPNMQGTEMIYIVHGDASISLWDRGGTELAFGALRLGINSSGFYKSTNNGSTKTYF